MKLKLIVLFFTLHSSLFTLSAQEVDSVYLSRVEQMLDSLERIQKVEAEVTKYEDKLLRKEMSLNLMQAFPLVRGGYAVIANQKFADEKARFRRYDWDGKDYIPASVPLAATWLLKAVGVESRSKLNRMITANALALAMSEGIVWGLKQAVNERRPDGRDNHSFPSGHSSFAFVGATILDREYGHLSPWISVGGYAVATGTQLLRLRHNAHYVHDVVMGATIGVVSTNLAYYIADRIFGEKGINRPRLYKGDVVRFGRFLEQPTSLSLASGFEFGSKKVDSRFAPDGSRLRLSSTFSVSLDYSYFFDSHWAAEAVVRHSTIGLSQVPEQVGEMLNIYHANLAVKYSHPVGLGQRVSLRLLAGERYNEKALTIPSAWDFEAGAGINLSLLDTKKYVVGFNLDYLHAFSHLCTDRWYFGSCWRILL